MRQWTHLWNRVEKLMWKILVEKIDKIQCSVHCVLWERLCELRVWIRKRMKNVTLGDKQTDTHVNIELEFCELWTEFAMIIIKYTEEETYEVDSACMPEVGEGAISWLLDLGRADTCAGSVLRPNDHYHNLTQNFFRVNFFLLILGKFFHVWQC